MNMSSKSGWRGNYHNTKNQEKLEAINPSGATYRFDSWNVNAKQHLSNQGFVVIKNILKPNEINHAKSLLWEFLNDLGWDRQDPSTWESRLINQKGIIWGNGAGQSLFQWYIRTRPNIVDTFAKVWSSQDIYAKKGITFNYKTDIITSFDGFSVFRPWYLDTKYLSNNNNASNWKTQSGWYHIDQNTNKTPNIETIQGIVTLYDQDKSTGSTVFIPKTHLLNHIQLFGLNRNGKPNLSKMRKDFVMISKQRLNQLKQKRILLCCKAGDLLLWDSRTIHCNSPSIISLKEMRQIHSQKLKQKMNECHEQSQKLKQQHQNDDVDDDDDKDNDDGDDEKKQQVSIKMSRTEKNFIDSMNDNYLKSKIRKNLNGMMNKIEYNGYIVEVVLWQNFDVKLFNNSKAYIFCLPWNTSLLWIPQWIDKITANNLKQTILDKIKFETPTLRFDKKNKHGNIIGVKEIAQNRKTAWVCNEFDQSVQNRKDTDILPAIPMEKWSKYLLKHASNTASNEFNAMLMIHYKNGNNSIALHSDDDYGLGQNSIISSLSLGAKRTFFIKSKEIDPTLGKKIEFKIPLIHGSFMTMNAGFQKYWLHSIPKERNVISDRINVTFRKYSLSKDRKKSNKMVDIDGINVPSLLRAVSYICMTPKIKVKNLNVIKQRIKAYESFNTCSHWPHKCQILHKPLGVKQQSVNDINDDLIKSLIGLDMLQNANNNNNHQKQTK